MNKLRILPLAFVYGFLWPAFASAACLPSQICWVTGGTAVADPNSAPFNFAGRGFSASGVVMGFVPGQLPFFNSVSEPGSFFTFFSGDIVGDNLQFELTVNGVPWGIPRGGDASALFFATLDIPAEGAANLSVPFGFQGYFTGVPEPFSPGLDCDVLNCVDLEFRGGGIVTYDVLTSGGEGGPTTFEVSPLTFTFAPVPEPATLSLFAVGLVGLAMWRKAPRCLQRHVLTSGCEAQAREGACAGSGYRCSTAPPEEPALGVRRRTAYQAALETG